MHKSSIIQPDQLLDVSYLKGASFLLGVDLIRHRSVHSHSISCSAVMKLAVTSKKATAILLINTNNQQSRGLYFLFRW